ncbi:MAG TPA: 2,3-bisphosphoglycerate-independent phosphoglycerate mutase [Candidatus Dojkabacteria bacterium]|nr:2,3-bisphosphoglycerate-independent phosphoglycerate mutase [Candidatus Dojkabacteria bacterium]
MMDFLKKQKTEEKDTNFQNLLDVRKFVTLIIMDGLGVYPDREGNAVLAAKTPFLDTAWTYGRSTLIHASGTYVGLPGEEPGNSEVGHLNLGAGQVVYQSLPRINDAIEASELKNNNVIKEMFALLRKRNSRLHLVGVLSPAGVHGHIAHLFSILDLCKANKIDPYIHVILDGRDTTPMEGHLHVQRLEDKLAQLGIGKIASIQGRFYGMDRDNRWDRTQLAYDVMVGISEESFTNPVEAVNMAYQRGEDDQYFKPRVRVDENNKPVGPVKDGDAILFWNFREDRARQLTKAFVLKQFTEFNRKNYPRDIYFATTTGYEEGLPANPIFPPLPIKKPLAEYLGENGKTQFHISETEKFMHVTYFFNGATEQPHPGEVFFKIPSARVVDYAEVPEMSAYGIKNEVVRRIKNIGNIHYDFILLNLANPDMLGHTGDFKATVRANEVVDECVAEISKETLAAGGAVIITADHGNCETMINRTTKQIDIAHTNNPVPLTILTSINEIEAKVGVPLMRIGTGPKANETGLLADVAPTALGLIGMRAPANMTGVDLRGVL